MKSWHIPASTEGVARARGPRGDRVRGDPHGRGPAWRRLETLRKWIGQAEVCSSGKTTGELAEIRELKKEVAELRRANQILRSGSAFFPAELDR